MEDIALPDFFLSLFGGGRQNRGIYGKKLVFSDGDNILLCYCLNLENYVMSKVKMIICIGSSCFARGNAENVKIVEDFMTLHGLSDELDIELSGGLCTSNCPDGPVVIVNDKIYKHVNRDVMQEIMESYFPVENGE